MHLASAYAKMPAEVCRNSLGSHPTIRTVMPGLYVKEGLIATEVLIRPSCTCISYVRVRLLKPARNDLNYHCGFFLFYYWQCT